MTLDTHWLAWATGIIDGEGCIRLARHKRADRPNDTWTIQVYVVNTDIRMLLKLRDMLGGTIAARSKRMAHHKPQWRWQVFSRKAIPVLEAVLPWLVTKRDQAELAISSQKFRGTVRRSSANLVELEKIADQMTFLKMAHSEYATH